MDEPIDLAPNMFYSVLCCTCLALGTLTNVLLLVAVSLQKDGHLKPYSRVFFQCCVLDLYTLTATALVQPFYLMIDGNYLTFHNGPLRAVPQPWNFIFLQMWAFGYYFSTVTNVAQFVLRYLIICRGIPMSNFGYFWTIAGGCCVVLLYNVSAYFGSYPSSDFQEELAEVLRNRTLPQGVADSLTASMDGRPDSYRCLIHCVYVLLMELACYAVAIFCSVRIRSTVEKSASAIDCEIHQNRVQISHQVTKTLCMQALLPLCALLLAVTCLVACSAEYITRAGLSFSFTRFLTYPVPWIPVLNPLITLVVIKPYRQFLLCRAGKVNAESNGIAAGAGKQARRGNAYVHIDLIT